MADKMADARCRCGKVHLQATGQPILLATCACSDCVKAGEILQNLPDAPPVVDQSGGVPYVLHRKNCVTCLSGADLLREHRLKPDSPTRRIVASCCNSFMFLDFTKGHWISMGRDRFGEVHSIKNAPKAKGQSVKLILLLVWDCAKTGFRSPELSFAKGKLEEL